MSAGFFNLSKNRLNIQYCSSDSEVSVSSDDDDLTPGTFSFENLIFFISKICTKFLKYRSFVQ